MECEPIAAGHTHTSTTRTHTHTHSHTDLSSTANKQYCIGLVLLQFVFGIKIIPIGRFEERKNHHLAKNQTPGGIQTPLHNAAGA